jgi:hypothetical protein
VFIISDECDIIAVDAYIDSFPVLAVAYVQVLLLSFIAYIQNKVKVFFKSMLLISRNVVQR